MNTKPETPDDDEDEWLPDWATWAAVHAIDNPGHKHNYAASMHLWKQAANSDFNDDVMFFLHAVARAIVSADAEGTCTPNAIRNACGLYGRKRDLLVSAAIDNLRNEADVMAAFSSDENGNPIPGTPYTLPNPSDIKKRLDEHPAARGVRNGKKVKAAKTAYETARKKP